MKCKQEYTPKYWVIHDPKSDDVMIETASKGAQDTEDKYQELTGSHYDDDGMELLLVSLEIAKMTV